MEDSTKCNICGELRVYYRDECGGWYCCINPRCKNIDANNCPECGMLCFQLGAYPLLYECGNCEWIWSYHYECLELSNPSNIPSKFIGYILYNAELENFYDDIFHNYDPKKLKSHKNFIKCKPRVASKQYKERTNFVWKCLRCNENYSNMDN